MLILGTWIGILIGFIVCALLSANKVKVDNFEINNKVVVGFVLLLVISLSTNVYLTEKVNDLENKVIKYQEVNGYVSRRLTTLTSKNNYLNSKNDKLLKSKLNYERAYIYELRKYN